MSYDVQVEELGANRRGLVTSEEGRAIVEFMKTSRANMCFEYDDEAEAKRRASAVWFLKYLKQINNDVTAAEKELEKSIRNEDLLRLMKLQKTLVYFNTSIRGNEVMIGKLQSIFQEKDYQNPDLVEDVVIELKQAYNTVNIYSDILTGTMDAFASIISNNVNTIMKRMTSISIILMVPTLIASFYGMNVDVHVDELPHAFSLIILISIMLSAMAFVIFKKIKWF